MWESAEKLQRNSTCHNFDSDRTVTLRITRTSFLNESEMKYQPPFSYSVEFCSTWYNSESSKKGGLKLLENVRKMKSHSSFKHFSKCSNCSVTTSFSSNNKFSHSKAFDNLKLVYAASLGSGYADFEKICLPLVRSSTFSEKKHLKI